MDEKKTCRDCIHVHKPSDDGYVGCKDKYGFCEYAGEFVQCKMEACLKYEKR